MGVTTSSNSAVTYEPIQTLTANGSSASLTFTSIPQTYTDLIMIINATQSAGPNQGVFRVGNGSVDTGSNYSDTYMYGNGSSANSGRNTNNTLMLADYLAAPGTSGDWNISIHHFMNYSNTTTYKTVLHRAGKATNGTDAIVSLWRSTAAINTIQFYVTGGVLSSGSTATLYGIFAA